MNSHIRKHLARAAGIGEAGRSFQGLLRPRATAATRAAGAAEVPRASQVSPGRSTTFVAPRDKNLDITKPYAHAYRETGRYGSHPSHDGFDDESGPE